MRIPEWDFSKWITRIIGAHMVCAALLPDRTNVKVTKLSVGRQSFNSILELRDPAHLAASRLRSAPKIPWDRARPARKSH
jgi:hypothetical protein